MLKIALVMALAAICMLHAAYGASDAIATAEAGTPVYRCPPGEIYDACAPEVSCQKNCTSSDIMCTQPCKQGCVCGPGRVRNNGTCVNESDCPKA